MTFFCFFFIFGTSLFTWKDDMELLFGDKPFEFRINDQPHDIHSDVEI